MKTCIAGALGANRNTHRKVWKPDLGRATGGRGPVHSAGGRWRTFQGLPGNVKINGNRRRTTVSGRPLLVDPVPELLALKLTLGAKRPLGCQVEARSGP